MSILKIGFIGVNSPTYYAEEYKVYETSINGLMQYGEHYGFDVVPYKQVISTEEEAEIAKKFFIENHVDFLLIQNSSFSMGDLIEVFTDCGINLGLWALSEPKSDGDIQLHGLVSLNMYTSIIKRKFKDQDIPFKWFYGNVDSEIFLSRFHSTVLAMKAVHKLKTVKICWVGNVAPTFDNMIPDLDALKEKYGVSVEIMPTTYIKEIADELTESEIIEAGQKFCKDVENIHVDSKIMEVGKLVYAALVKISKMHNYDAMSLACWPDFQELFGIVPCVPFTELYDINGIPVSCEGDLQGLITMVMLNEMTNNKSMLMDLTSIDLDNDMLMLWHCGLGSKTMASCKNDISIIKHPMMNRKEGEVAKVGLSYDFYFKNTDVTVARISDNGEGIFFFNGEITDDNTKGFVGTRGWIKNLNLINKKTNVQEVIETIMSEGIEHHLIIVDGNCGDAISEFCYWTKTRLIEMREYKNYQ